MEPDEHMAKTVFEIPIYAYSPEEYKKRWDRQKEKTVIKLIHQGYSEERARKCTEDMFYYKSSWRYNKLVGILQLTVRDDCLYFNLYGNSKPPRNILINTTLPFVNQFLFDSKFNIREIKDDVTLITGIKEEIESIKSIRRINNFYFDCHALEATISIAKLKNIIKE